VAEEIRELGLNLGGLPTHDPRTPGTLPGDVARFVDLADRVANPTALAALDTTTFLSGKTRIAEVHSLQQFFYFDPTSSATADGTTVIAPAVGSGRWLIWPGGGSTIPRVADLTALAALPTSGYPATSAHLAEVITTQAVWRFYPVTTRGAFSNITAYVAGDKVFYLGSIYIAIASTTGNLPTNGSFWRLYFGGVSGITVASNDLLGMWCRLTIADVPNLATLALVPGICIPVGTTVWCNVTTVGDSFRYVPSGTTAPDGITVVPSADGLGQWHRMGIANQTFLQATYWSLSPATGNDENAGWGMDVATADSRPLRTMQELNRRLVGWQQDNTAGGLTNVSISIHIMDDVADTSSFAILNNLASPNGNKYVRVIGGLSPVDGAASNRTLTGYVAANPATNVEREVVIAGIGLKPSYVGKIIQTTDGLKTATIERQKSADRFSISQVVDNGGGIDGSLFFSVTEFAVGDHVNILDAVKIASWPFPSAGVQYPLAAQLRFDAAAVSGVYPASYISEGFASAVQCILGSGTVGPLEFAFQMSGNASFSAIACAIYGNNANVFYGGFVEWTSVGVVCPGPLYAGDCKMLLFGEVLFTGTGHALRATGDSPLSIVVDDTCQIGQFDLPGAAFDLLSTHSGVPGEIWGSDDNGGNRSKWYGSGNTGVPLIIGKGARCKFPRLGITVTTSAPGFVNMAGLGAGDANNNYPASDIPIVDLSTLTMLNDSNSSGF